MYHNCFTHSSVNGHIRWEELSLNHWNAREVTSISFLDWLLTDFSFNTGLAKIRVWQSSRAGLFLLAYYSSNVPSLVSSLSSKHCLPVLHTQATFVTPCSAVSVNHDYGILLNERTQSTQPKLILKVFTPFICTFQVGYVVFPEIS